MSSHPHTNRLVNEKSPYLLQHAHNPVDWYPWGKEAFITAAQQDKPIFLSIGYATCHWCHVMEEECFSNEQIAALMNEAFINIKVDREELPEIDSLYMEFAQSMIAGAVGWPLNVLLTPDLKPFFAATYLPPQGRQGMMGMDDLVRRINEIWKGDQRERLLEQAARIVEVFSETQKTAGEVLPDPETIENAAEAFYRQGDPVYGGIKGTPKFPIGYQWSFLLRCYRQLQDGRALFLAERTLDMMYRGGIYDHLGGGFARYSVDDKWLVPHFEKMLYDNAIITTTYVEGWLVTQNPQYRRIVEEIVEYLMRDMTGPEGGFYSAEDADSEGHEGRFYIWTVEELESILGKEEAQLFGRIYGATAEGNFEGRNILYLPHSVEEVADRNYMNVEQLRQIIDRQRHKLWEAREKRVHPFKDDKVLCSWNGLMIDALATAGCVFGEEHYLAGAERAAKFILKNMWREDRLLRRWRDGEARFNATLDDYAFLIKGLLTLFEAGRGYQYLQLAQTMTDILRDSFKSERGAFMQTDGKDENLIMRKCQFADGAEPSGNAIHCENLLRLYALTWDRQYRQQAEDILRAAKKYMELYPLGYTYHLLALQRHGDSHAATIVVALNDQNALEAEIRNLLYTHFFPHKVIIWRRPSETKLLEALPFVQKQVPVDNQTTLYICHQGVCKQPLTAFSDMEAAIKKL